jgi:hypothetical protein
LNSVVLISIDPLSRVHTLSGHQRHHTTKKPRKQATRRAKVRFASRSQRTAETPLRTRVCFRDHLGSATVPTDFDNSSVHDNLVFAGRPANWTLSFLSRASQQPCLRRASGELDLVLPLPRGLHFCGRPRMTATRATGRSSSRASKRPRRYSDGEPDDSDWSCGHDSEEDEQPSGQQAPQAKKSKKSNIKKNGNSRRNPGAHATTGPVPTHHCKPIRHVPLIYPRFCGRPRARHPRPGDLFGQAAPQCDWAHRSRSATRAVTPQETSLHQLRAEHPQRRTQCASCVLHPALSPPHLTV